MIIIHLIRTIKDVDSTALPFALGSDRLLSVFKNNQLLGYIPMSQALLLCYSANVLHYLRVKYASCS